MNLLELHVSRWKLHRHECQLLGMDSLDQITLDQQIRLKSNNTTLTLDSAVAICTALALTTTPPQRNAEQELLQQALHLPDLRLQTLEEEVSTSRGLECAALISHQGHHSLISHLRPWGGNPAHEFLMPIRDPHPWQTRACHSQEMQPWGLSTQARSGLLKQERLRLLITDQLLGIQEVKA